MKLDARSAARILRDPGALRVILLHGDDTGLVRERARTAALAVAPDLDDPFRVAVLDRDAPERLEEEVFALSLTGGRRVVWVRDATDAMTTPLKHCLGQASDTLVIVEAPGLASRSRLRTLVESHAETAAIACYPEEGRALEASIRQMLAAEEIRIDPDALSWFAGLLGPDRAATRGEVEKLALYAGRGGQLSLDDVRTCIGDAAGVSLEDAAFAATAGDRAAADMAIERALAEGTSPIAIARSLLSHLHRLRRARLAMDSGQSRTDAMRALRPPVFFKRTESFGQALSLWTADRLMDAAEQTQSLELACKQTGAPDLTLCRRHIARLAGTAMMLRRDR
ncbi:DNA polymerase III subunit delta [Gluconacetobacter azotocaptans]|uniref:DNA-directed DNA polymerase n=1 Tax=Gluconacetobacter azotocaptans TaxID=142834 RepID=A0A7W4JPU8_9PROT|nr:DNA polymerase III subunit delta [Gluconacetobacter azotocaptans]MBB2188726.1 DNA polymerase III subunit delta [Gluconacetobacter azotocaptans]MBM9400477.1 DNA polymerase III subunit delta [Gluconacetobacter azotocaptans]GBQ34921.1 DNA polymerase III subunit delta [Gluconacetobacter azotocaptans DSM 13594]